MSATGTAASDTYKGAYIAVGREGVPYAQTKTYRYEGETTIWEPAVDRPYGDYDGAIANRGPIDVEVRRKTAAATPTPTPTPTGTTPAAGGGFMDSKIDLPIIGEVPTWLALAVAAAAVVGVMSYE